MLGMHLGKAITEHHGAGGLSLLQDAADDVGLPADPEFRRRSRATRVGHAIALANSQPDAHPATEAPVPAMGMRVAPAFTPAQ